MASDNLTFFVPYHTGYAHAEFIHSFASFAHVNLFIYKWNPARERLKEYFSGNDRIQIDEFSIETILDRIIENRQKKVVVLLTASTNYSLGQLQIRLFKIIRRFVPWLIDVYPIGHCMYGCQSCAYGYTHRIPVTFTSYMQRKDEKLQVENDFEILICPSYSFEDAPYSFLSNKDIMDYISTLTYSHAIKLHPMAYDTFEEPPHPFLTLTDLERHNVTTLYGQSKYILPAHYTNTLKLIENARVIICDSNSSIPFETLYFHDEKFLFVYEREEEYDEQDDRQNFFHKFQDAEQLKTLLSKYFNKTLDCKTENSHAFFLEKYDEPDGNEIEKLAYIREWLSPNEDEENNDGELTWDPQTVKDAVHEEYRSIKTPMVLYVLGDHTMSQIVERYSNEDDDIFYKIQENVNEL